jgi:hypothetical protein
MNESISRRRAKRVIMTVSRLNRIRGVAMMMVRGIVIMIPSIVVRVRWIVMGMWLVGMGMGMGI